MKSAFWRSLAVVAILAAPMTAFANDATIGSEVANNAMYGGTLMNTTAIFNAFPHMVVNNGTGIELNTMGDGMGKIWWEAYDELWLTMDAGRMDYGMSGSAFMWGRGWSLLDPFDGTAFENAMMLNLGVAKPTANGGGWAVGVKLAPMGGLEVTPEGGTAAEYNLTGYGLNASWGNGEGLDVGAEFSTTSAEIMGLDEFGNGALLEQKDSNLGFGANVRFDTDSWIYQGNFSFISGTEEVEAVTDDVEGSALGLNLNAGRYLKNEVDGQASVEFGLGWVSLSEDNTEIDLGGGPEIGNVSTTLFLLPAVRVSAWEMIGDHFGLMGGLGFTHAMTSGDFEDTTTYNAETKINGSIFDWSAGLFFQPTDNVRIDARFEEGNLNQIMSMGNQSPLVMYLGVTVGLN